VRRLHLEVLLRRGGEQDWFYRLERRRAFVQLILARALRPQRLRAAFRAGAFPDRDAAELELVPPGFTAFVECHSNASKPKWEKSISFSQKQVNIFGPFFPHLHCL
jgi:hypothetical protein